jgi:hypothetical protein
VYLNIMYTRILASLCVQRLQPFVPMGRKHLVCKEIREFKSYVFLKTLAHTGIEVQVDQFWNSCRVG